MEHLLHFLEVLVISVFGLIGFVVLLFALLLALPNSPLRDIVAAFAKRMAATAALAAIALPAQQIPALGAVYDVTATIILVAFWMSVFETIGRALRSSTKSTSTAVARIEPGFRDEEQLEAPESQERLTSPTRKNHA